MKLLETLNEYTCVVVECGCELRNYKLLEQRCTTKRIELASLFLTPRVETVVTGADVSIEAIRARTPLKQN